MLGRVYQKGHIVRVVAIPVIVARAVFNIADTKLSSGYNKAKEITEPTLGV